VVSGDLQNFFTIRIMGPVGTYLNMVKGDPIIFCRLDNDTPNIQGGFILSKIDSDITISPDMTTFAVERRKSPRYPLSLLGQVNRVNNRKCSVPAWIKDISHDGIRIYTESGFNVKDKIGINIDVGTRVLDIEGIIVRSALLFGRNEYGIQIAYRYKSTVFNLKESIDYLVEQEKKLIEDHLLGIHK
jgi:hypothetical protein